MVLQPGVPLKAKPLKPFHSSLEHRRAERRCPVCHSSHRGRSANILRQSTIEGVCASCHKASDIAKWKTARAYRYSSRELLRDRVRKHFSNIAPSMFGTGEREKE